MENNIGVLFDLDGVLIDSEGIYTQFWDEIEKVYPTGIENFAHVIKGSNLAKILKTYYPNKELQSKIVDMLNDFQSNMKYEIFPGVMEFVEELNKRNIPCCIVTSSDADKMKHLSQQHPTFLSHFQGLIVGEMVTNSKPDPECFLLGAKTINRNIKNCYVFEDSILGMKAGLDSGAKLIALATTLNENEIKIKANKIINNFIGFNVDDMLNI